MRNALCGTLITRKKQIGWALWNIIIGALFCKSTIVLYDGSPFYPEPRKFVKAVFETGFVV